MNDVEIHSTPISISQNKKADDGGMLKDLYSMICSMKESSEKQYTVLNEMKRDNEVKFNVLSSGVNEVNIKL